MPTPDFSKVWASNSPLPEYTFSDADYLEESNNVLIDFGRAYNENGDAVSHIVEVDKETNEVVFEYHLTQTERSDRRQIYRAERLPLYPENYTSTSFLDE